MVLPEGALRIASAEAALAFSRDKPRAILFELMRAERSAGGLRMALGFSPSLLHHHLTKLRRSGLIEVVQHLPRAGRPIAVYQAVSRSFVVAGEALDHRAGLNARAELDAALDRDGARVSDILYCLGPDGEPRVVRLPPQVGRRSGGEWWWRLALSTTEADELAREIRNVVERFRQPSKASGRTHLVHFAIARL